MFRNLILLLFVIFVSQPAVDAQSYDRQKIWDKEIDSISDFDRRQSPPDKAILFVGSSSIRLWATLRTDFPRRKIINRGFGGSRIEDSVYYFDRLVTPHNPREIVLYAGENDINDGLSPERVAADFVRFATLVREKLPRAKLYFVSLKPSPSRWAKRAEMMKANELIRAEISRLKNATFVDVWPAMLGANGEPRPELFVADKLHMNSEGYAIWRGILAKYLK